jgi:hypothetical protein
MDTITSALALILLMASIIMWKYGKKRNNTKVKNIGLGMLVGVVALMTPDAITGFTEGFIKGWNSAGNEIF